MADFFNFADPAVQAALMVIFAGGLVVVGGFGLMMGRDKAAARMRALAPQEAPAVKMKRTQDATPSGWKKALIPEDVSERAQIQFQLAKVGFDHHRAVETFFVLRLILALTTPALVLFAVVLTRLGLMPGAVSVWIGGISTLGLMQIAAVGAAVGFYGPGYWLSSRIKQRQQRIRNGFPNALDLLQIAVESGLGFDAALHRVGVEISRVAPDIAFEFLLLRKEVQAGADREKALHAMAERMGIDEAKSLVLVVTQSMQFGTSLTTSLKNYAEEMREMRELKAQEKANKLPVQMSGVMSFLMLPALFLITLTPIIIRYSAIY